MFNNSVPSLADIAAVTNNNDGIGGNNGWWVLIILFALFGGWGNAGYAYGGNGGVSEHYTLASDFATLQRQIDTSTADLKGSTTAIANGLSSLGYDQLSQMNGINNNINQSTNALTAQMSNLGFQLQQCCCDNKQAIAQLRYDNATNTCALNNAISNATQQIIQNDNANYRQLHDENIAIQMAGKDDRIAALTAQVNALNLAASQQAQNEYLVSRLGGGCCSGCNC